jgi:hypothetical protein
MSLSVANATAALAAADGDDDGGWRLRDCVATADYNADDDVAAVAKNEGSITLAERQARSTKLF